MEEEAKGLKTYLKGKFGNVVKLTYVDVASDEMKDYPDIPSVLSNIRLPLIVLNGEPRFYGGISAEMVENAVREILSKEITE
jgi:hypothetical protein